MFMLHVKRQFLLQAKELSLANSQKRGNFSQKRGNFSQKWGNFSSLLPGIIRRFSRLMSKRRREAGLPVWLKLTGLAVYLSFEGVCIGSRSKIEWRSILRGCAIRLDVAMKV